MNFLADFVDPALDGLLAFRNVTFGQAHQGKYFHGLRGPFAMRFF